MGQKHDKKLKQLVRSLNSERHQQAKKIDILCNDIVGAHADFVNQLQILTFGAGFYESILGCDDLNSILDVAARGIAKSIEDARISFFLLENGGFEVHLADDDNPIDVETCSIESCFTPDVVGNISRATRISSLDDMYKMGLQGNISVLNKLSVAAVPLGGYSSPIGFVLIYRDGEVPLTTEELSRVTAVTGGLASAIRVRKSTNKTISAV
ncbi:MAG: hypothetical protein KAS23_16970 [Anaerohalosphaera sp.]|nr:hypothetical protein [Anaerohalosphaera sp.]